MKSLKLIALFLLAFTSVGQADKPNIVVLFIDDMGYADPSCFGNPLMETPHIDRLASEGLKLTNFYVNSPICSASRVALTTGQYQGRWKIHSFLNTRAGNANRGMADYLDAAAPTTAKKLKAAGYATAHFGKWHMGGGRDVDDAPLPQAYGFDESLVSFEGLGDRIISNEGAMERQRALGHGEITLVKRWEKMQIQTDRSIDFIRRNKDKPFYLRLFPNDVHDRHDPIPGSAEKYAAVSDDPFIQNFFAVLEEMDRQIGRLVATIDELGLGENTLILFTSDNGPTDWPKKYETGPPAGYTGPYRGRKWSLFEGGVRMPFIARWTGTIPAGLEDNTSVVTAIDLSPTLCQLAGVPFEEELDGLDCSEVLLGNPAPRAEPVFWQYGHPHAILKGGKPGHQSPTFAMRDGDWKFLVNPDGSEAQLYNLAVDEGEQENLLNTEPERAASMASQIDTWAEDLEFDFDGSAPLTEPIPTVAIRADGQLIRFVNHGVEEEGGVLQFGGNAWLDLPAFRAPKVAGGRSLRIQGTVRPESKDGVLFAHGGKQSGYAIYLDGGHLCYRACVDGKVADIRTEEPLGESADFEAHWRPEGEVFLKVNGQLVEKVEVGEMVTEPVDSIQIGADSGDPVGDYEAPNAFAGKIENLTFRYPNGT